jgi:hypothetical protein
MGEHHVIGGVPSWRVLEQPLFQPTAGRPIGRPTAPGIERLTGAHARPNLARCLGDVRPSGRRSVGTPHDPRAAAHGGSARRRDLAQDTLPRRTPGHEIRDLRTVVGVTTPFALRADSRLRYTPRRNAMTREQYALPSISQRAGTVEAGIEGTRNSPAEQHGRPASGQHRSRQAEPGWRPIAAPTSGPTVGL